MGADDAQRYQNLDNQVSRLSITETSPDGTLEVTVSASGLLTRLVFHPEPQLAAEIMECLRRAQAKIPELLRQAIFDTIGPGDASTHLLLDEARRRFPEQRPTSPPEPQRDSIGD